MIDALVRSSELWWAIVALAGVFALVVLVRKFSGSMIRRRRLERAFGAESFDADAIRRATENYVEPDCVQLDAPGVQAQPLRPRMDELLSRVDGPRHYLLLADSGMGKTTFLLNYCYRNQQRRPSKRLRIVMVRLGRPETLSKLESVQHPTDTVAFVDGLDEDADAIDSGDQRIEQIMAACANFKRVVISCSTAPGGHAFEKIQLAPFSERQINEYLRRSLPWFQRSRRRRANAVVTSMSDLAAQPMLLALVPELVTGGRKLSEPFELYEFMVERWLERERGWIEPDLLRSIAEKLAVESYLRLSTGGGNRSESMEIAASQTPKLEQWQFGARSLLIADAAGRLRFVHRSVLEYLFVCTLARDEDRTLTVRWSHSMRRLFVSWANVMEQRQGKAAVREMLARDFAATGVFPLSEPHRDPLQLQTSQILATESRDSETPQASPVWDPTTYVTEHGVEHSLYLCDRSSDAIIFVPTDWRRIGDGVDAESARLFLATRSEADNQLAALNKHRKDGRDNWRAPTLEELDLVFRLNLELGFLPHGQFVWSSDHTTDGERVVAQMTNAVDGGDRRLNPIGVRKVVGTNANAIDYFVSSMPPLGIRDRRGRYDASFQALLVRVSQGAAQSFSKALGDAPGRGIMPGDRADKPTREQREAT